jgi:glycosyltransferase involved in cell wall biosynthesis
LASAAQNPRITIVTPSYNQAPFIEQTILSVIGQGYEPLEYFVFDGGSTDGTVDILKRYAGRITHWQSKPDGGQAAAINEGLARATGDIVGWLNSDDYYLPKTLARAATLLDPARPQLLAGNCIHVFEETGAVLGSFVPRRHREMELRLADYLIQPSTLWTAAAWKSAGPLLTTMHYAFDWEWFVRAQQSGVEILATEEYLSVYRIHADHKSAKGTDRRTSEIRDIYVKYSGDSYARLFDILFTNQNIRRLRVAMRRVRTEHLFPKVARRLWPSLLGRYAEREIRDVSAMT